MRVLITGHRGYVGTVLSPILAEEGHEVAGLDSDLFGRCTFGDPPAEIPWTRKDIRDVEVADFNGFDAVVHLAGLSNDPLGDLNPALTYEINHEATVRLARLAKGAGVKRFIFSSSCSIYGAAGGEWVAEDAEFRPVTPYGHSKTLTERDLAQMADSDFSPTFMRSATVYGMSPRLRFDLVLNNLVAWAFTTGKVFLKSDGSAWRPIVHVEDMARAFAAALRAPREAIHSQAFNVGISEENRRVRDLAGIVEQTVPDCRIEYAEGAQTDRRSYRVDCEKLPRTLPDFRPRWNAQRGAKQLHEAYRRIGLQLADFEGPRYKRVDHIKMLLSDGHLDNSLRWS
jgi:nucleoside-diphosphate-sugar epimerase